MDPPLIPTGNCSAPEVDNLVFRKDNPASSNSVQFPFQLPLNLTSLPGSATHVSSEHVAENTQPLFNKGQPTTYSVIQPPTDGPINMYNAEYLKSPDYVKNAQLQAGKLFPDGRPQPANTSSVNGCALQDSFCKKGGFQPVYLFNPGSVIPAKLFKLSERMNLAGSARLVAPKEIRPKPFIPINVQQVFQIPDKFFRSVDVVNNSNGLLTVGFISKPQRPVEESTISGISLTGARGHLFTSTRPQNTEEGLNSVDLEVGNEVECYTANSQQQTPVGSAVSEITSASLENSCGDQLDKNNEAQSNGVGSNCVNVSDSQGNPTRSSFTPFGPQSTLTVGECKSQDHCATAVQQQSCTAENYCMPSKEQPMDFPEVLLPSGDNDSQGASERQSLSQCTQTNLKSPGQLNSHASHISGSYACASLTKTEATHKKHNRIISESPIDLHKNVLHSTVNQSPRNSGDMVSALPVATSADQLPQIEPFMPVLQKDKQKHRTSTLTHSFQAQAIMRPCCVKHTVETDGLQKERTSDLGNTCYMSKSLTDINADGITKCILSNTSDPNNALSECCCVKTGNSNCSKERKTLQNDPLKRTDVNLCSGLEILETVSLSDVALRKQNRLVHSRLSEGFYRCGCLGGTCSFSSLFQVNLASHMRLMHSTEKEFVCVHCGSWECSPNRLLYHLNHHLDFQRFSLYCTHPDCNFHSFNPGEVINHMTICHPDHDVHVCWFCSQWFETLQQLKLHIRQNILCVAMCPHCDAKGIGRQRILKHVTRTHPNKGRMIVFHKLLLCGERNMSGWKVDRFFDDQRSAHTPTAQTQSDKASDTITTTAVCDRSDNSSSGETATNSPCDYSDHYSACSPVTTKGDDSENDLRLQICGQSPEQKMTEQNAMNDRICQETSEKNINETQTCLSDPEDTQNHSQKKGNESCEDTINMETKQQNEHTKSTKLVFVRNGVHFECLDPSLRKASEKEKLLMEPVDLEISADETGPEDSGFQEESEMRSKGDTAKPSSSKSLPKKGNEEKVYKCTVVSAGRSIKLVSSNATSDENASGVATPEKPDKPTKKGKQGETSRQTVIRYTYACRLCHYTSGFSRGVYQHIYANHKHLVACPLCQAKCKSRSTLLDHLIKHHPDEAKDIFNEGKLSKWIRITRNGERKKTKKRSPIIINMPSLEEQDYPVKDYFVISNLKKERSIHCMLCNYSFKKYHRSNANVYRSMYKHLFLHHLPHEYKCPACHFTDDTEEETRKHMKDVHGDSEDQNPEIVVQRDQPIQRKALDMVLRSKSGSRSSGLQQSKRVQKRKADDSMDPFPMT